MPSLKQLRRLAYRGNSLYVQLPKDIANAMRWRAGDGIVIEAVRPGVVELHLVRETDLLTTAVGPMTLTTPAGAGK